MCELHVYKLGPDCVIAESVDDAWMVWCRAHGERREDYDGEPGFCRQLPDAKMLSIHSGDESDIELVTMNCAYWAMTEGRGILCSSEW